MDTKHLPTRAQDMFCHAVYVASHVINRAYGSHLKKLGLTYPQYITLTLLWERDGRRITDIGDHLAMKTSTVTPLIKRLEKLGMIKRQRNDSDERQIDVFLTADGLALESQAPDITACMIHDTGLELDELTKLRGLLTTLSANLALKSQ